MIQIHFEPQSVCNAACHFCPYPTAENSRLKGHMTWDLYKKIIDEAKGIPDITELAFSGLGETMLDPLIVERVAYARDARPEWFTELYTNGVYLTAKRFRALKDAGIGSISISLNAVRPEQHEKIMGLKGKFDQVCENINYAIENRVRADGTEINLLVKGVASGDDFNEQDIGTFYSRWGHKKFGKGGYGLLVIEANWAGANRTIRSFDPKSPCMRALAQIAVDWTGQVLLCCFDPLAKRHPVFGDLKKQTIKEVYNSDAYTAFRQAHDEGRADEYAACKGCTRI